MSSADFPVILGKAVESRGKAAPRKQSELYYDI
jgi:hypothetical protein